MGKANRCWFGSCKDVNTKCYKSSAVELSSDKHKGQDLLISMLDDSLQSRHETTVGWNCG